MLFIDINIQCMLLKIHTQLLYRVLCDAALRMFLNIFYFISTPEMLMRLPDER